MSENNVQEQNIIQKTMEEVMHNSMIPYSEHVIMERALPRVEDGLKPVQRRILYSLYELGVTPDKPYRKSARIVGDCLGKYHPHGDRSVYDAMVRMAQPFNMRHMLIDGHGNYGSVDGDSAAAMRYTEARLAPLAMELLRDLEKDTVKWSLNFDDTIKEPDMLPGRFPNLLVNGASGIAVGLATNIPTHNLGEVIDGVIAYIHNPKITLKEMMKIIKGPDFPTGGYIIAGSELYKAYETGKGKITIRAKIHIEVSENDKKSIVIDELPYQVNKAALLESIMEYRESKKEQLSGISEILDESDRNGMRAVIKVKKDADPRAICDILFKYTQLSQSFGINMVAIADGKPQQMGLLDIIAYYVNYQREVIVKRTKYELNEAQNREHILTGLMIAVANIDEVVKIIKTSASVNDARNNLCEKFLLSEIQAQAILDLRLARLTHLEVHKLEKELAEVRELIKKLQTILGSKKVQMEVIVNELNAIKKQYKEPRRTVILDDVSEYYIPSDDDEKPIENFMIGYNENGALKRIPIKNYSMSVKEFTDSSSKNDIHKLLEEAQTYDKVYCFTNLGNCYKVDVLSIPEAKWRDKGDDIKSCIPDIQKDEKVIKMFVIKENLPTNRLLFFTREGMIKKSDWSEYGVVKSSFQAVKLKEGDEVINIEEEIQKSSILFITALGMGLNADPSDVPTQGRISSGVKGILLSEDDYVVFAGQVTEHHNSILMISDKSSAKKIELSELGLLSRYRKGLKVFDLKGDSGDKLIWAAPNHKKDKLSIILIDDDDYMTAFSSDDVLKSTRTGKSKNLCKLNKNHYIKDVFLYNS
ncbi:MAG TPA: DNA topoisomerase (ATP-hydrolyzing) [Clostridia bacterium]